ncbi:MAG TPA: precorrin-3B synthase [Xanthobacteraceae bacterium]|nr:precorrin-3B synthase [Xanthobacteraceae bacterium]
MNVIPPRRRGACPGLTAPMQTGDGLLVRIASQGVTVGLDAATALCAAARRHGNRIIEITARGNIQIRGLTPASAPTFADAVAALGIDGGDGVPILTDLLAGLEPLGRGGADSLPPCGGGSGWGVVPWGTEVPHLATPTPDPSPQGGGEKLAASSRLKLAPRGLGSEHAAESFGLAAALRQQLAAAPFTARLGPKVSVVIDGGRALHLDAVRADIRLRAGSAGWHVGLGGDAKSATPIGWVAPVDAVDSVARLLATIAQHGPRARALDLVQRHGPDAFRTAIAEVLIEAPSPAPRPASDPVGTHSLRDGRLALGIAFAFGHTEADAFESLIEAARRAGADSLRTAPGRALVVIGLADDTASDLAAHAEGLGFITRRDDARRRVVACAGAPICASAEIPARALAPLISSAAAGLLDGALTIHVSGCAKGCAHPGPSGLAIVGDRSGCGLVVDGSARDRPVATIAAADVPAAFGLITRAVTSMARPGETSADALARLGATRLAAIFGAARHG